MRRVEPSARSPRVCCGVSVADAGINAVEKAIFARLDHASITALVPAARHYTSIIRPQTVYPCVVVSYLHSNPDGIDSFGGDAETLDYIIRAYEANQLSVETVGDIAEAIDARLVGATLSATGYSGGVFGIRRVRWVRGIETDHREVEYQPKMPGPFPYAGAVYRFWVQRS
jgi:hypothetical protein